MRATPAPTAAPPCRPAFRRCRQVLPGLAPLLDLMGQIAQRRGKTLSQVAINWAICQVRMQCPEWRCWSWGGMEQHGMSWHGTAWHSMAVGDVRRQGMLGRIHAMPCLCHAMPSVPCHPCFGGMPCRTAPCLASPTKPPCLPLCHALCRARCPSPARRTWRRPKITLARWGGGSGAHGLQRGAVCGLWMGLFGVWGQDVRIPLRTWHAHGMA